MSLIECPECGQRISDKSKACIHCGYPLEELSSNVSETILHEQVINMYPMYLDRVTDSFVAIKCGKCNSIINYMKGSFNISKDDCITKTPLICSKCGNRVNSNTSIQKQKTYVSPPAKTNSVVKCPRCGSTQIQLMQRKWSPMTGILTNKVDRVCMNCKHKF